MSIITISRGTFSGGKELAECVAADLKYTCLSREVILEAADQFGVPSAALSAAIEKPPSFISRFRHDRDLYLSYIRVALCRDALRDNLVYHGHAGHFLLPDIPHVIRVRVVADLEYRIDAAMKRLNTTRSKAISYIQKVDSERAKWTRFLFGETLTDPSHYDLVVNLHKMSLRGACSVVLQTAKLNEFKTTESSRKDMEDLYLFSRIQAALCSDVRTNACRFQVHVRRGRVTVEGVAKLQESIDAIPEILKDVEGIADLSNEMVIGVYHGI